MFTSILLNEKNQDNLRNISDQQIHVFSIVLVTLSVGEYDYHVSATRHHFVPLNGRGQHAKSGHKERAHAKT